MLVYGTYTQEELDAQYDTSLPVGGNSAPYLERFTRESERARETLAHEADLRYGDHERETIDYFPAAPGAPLFVWVHGGYWRRLSKDANTFVAEMPVRAGAAVALVNYPLAPEVDLDRIVASVRAAHAFAVTRASADGALPARVVAGGHSVGAQLAAAIAATAPIDGLFALSGLYDLEPIRLSNVNDTIAMDEASSVRNAPLHMPPARASRLVISTGGREQDEFHRQQRAYAAAWRAWGGDVTEIDSPEDDHFSIVLELAKAESALSGALHALLFEKAA
jgi:arylformamidase